MDKIVTTSPFEEGLKIFASERTAAERLLALKERHPTAEVVILPAAVFEAYSRAQTTDEAEGLLDLHFQSPQVQV